MEKTRNQSDISSFLNRLTEMQRKPIKMPMSMEAVIEFLGFSNWPFNFDKKDYRKDIKLDVRVAKQIWESAIQKSVTDSVKPDNYLRFLILTLWCLQVLQETEGSGREVEMGDFLFLDSENQLPIDG